MDGFELHVTLEANDVRSYAKAKRSTLDIVLSGVMWLGFLFVYIVGVGVTNSLTGQPVFGLVAMAAVIYGMNWLISERKKEQYEKVAKEFVDYDLIVNREAIVQKLGRTETKYAWADLAIVQATEEFLEMKMWDGAVILLPKHLFQNEEDYQASRIFIEERLKWVEVGHA